MDECNNVRKKKKRRCENTCEKWSLRYLSRWSSVICTDGDEQGEQFLFCLFCFCVAVHFVLLYTSSHNCNWRITTIVMRGKGDMRIIPLGEFIPALKSVSVFISNKFINSDRQWCKEEANWLTRSEQYFRSVIRLLLTKLGSFLGDTLLCTKQWHALDVTTFYQFNRSWWLLTDTRDGDKFSLSNVSASVISPDRDRLCQTRVLQKCTRLVHDRRLGGLQTANCCNHKVPILSRLFPLPIWIIKVRPRTNHRRSFRAKWTNRKCHSANSLLSLSSCCWVEHSIWHFH